MEANLFSRCVLGSKEFFNDGKNISELFVVFLLKSFDLASEIAIRIHEPAQLHERSHDCDIDFHRTLRTQDTGEHCNALFCKGIGATTCTAMLP